jgi:hypothetical protein
MQFVYSLCVFSDMHDRTFDHSIPNVELGEIIFVALNIDVRGIEMNNGSFRLCDQFELVCPIVTIALRGVYIYNAPDFCKFCGKIRKGTTWIIYSKLCCTPSTKEV